MTPPLPTRSEFDLALRRDTPLACVLTIVTCQCGARTTWSVRVRRTLAASLLCSPDVEVVSTRTVIRCLRCRRPTGWTVRGLREAVESALDIGHDYWAARGAVTLES